MTERQGGQDAGEMVEDARRHCHRCELPKPVCACTDASAYDRWWRDFGSQAPHLSNPPADATVRE